MMTFRRRTYVVCRCSLVENYYYFWTNYDTSDFFCFLQEKVSHTNFTTWGVDLFVVVKKTKTDD